jgi:hypothetical protein
MRNDFADLTVVLDRSGSMAVCKDDAERGINEFVKDHREQPGECAFSLVQFDTAYEFIHRAVPIKDVPECALRPRGGTALLDAVGRAIIETDKRMKSIDGSQRPGLVVFVIVTDGGENSSREFTKAKIKEMIEGKTRGGWQFVFLGANQDAFAEAGGIGIPKMATAGYDAKTKTRDAIRMASQNVTRMRRAAATGETIFSAFTDAERRGAQNSKQTQEKRLTLN